MAAVGIDIGREAITWGLEESRSDPRKHLHFLRFCKHCPSGQAFETKLTIGSAHIVRQGKPSRQSSQVDMLREQIYQEAWLRSSAPESLSPVVFQDGG